MWLKNLFLYLKYDCNVSQNGRRHQIEPINWTYLIVHWHSEKDEMIFRCVIYHIDFSKGKMVWEFQQEGKYKICCDLQVKIIILNLRWSNRKQRWIT